MFIYNFTHYTDMVLAVAVWLLQKCSTKMIKHKIMQTKPHYHVKLLIFWIQKS